MITAIEAVLRKIEDAIAIQSLYIATIKDLDELIRDAAKDGEYQVTFECKNLDIANKIINDLKKNLCDVEISDHCRNYITIYWRQ